MNQDTFAKDYFGRIAAKVAPAGYDPKQLGMQVFLLTDCLINKSGEDIDQYPHGGFDVFEEFLSTLEY